MWDRVEGEAGRETREQWSWAHTTARRRWKSETMAASHGKAVSKRERRNGSNKRSAGEQSKMKRGRREDAANWWENRLQPHLLALVDSSLEFLLMLTLLSFFLGVLVSFSVCWLEDEDEEELVLALESSSDIATPPPHTPTWRGDTTGHGEQTVNTNTHRERQLTISLCVWVMLPLKGPRVSLSSSQALQPGGRSSSPPCATNATGKGERDF